MEYVLDTSILIEISQHYYPEVFPSLWAKINNLILNVKVMSLKEVQLELGKGQFNKDWSLINANANNQFFKELNNNEMTEFPKIENLDIYNERFKINNKYYTSLAEDWGTYGVAVADPLLICYGLHHGSTVVTMENPNKGHNIPHVCFNLNVRCIGLRDFFIENDFKF